MKKKSIGIGIVGGGFIARFHIRSWVGVRDADILGVVSRREDTAAAAAALAQKLRVGKENFRAEMGLMPVLSSEEIEYGYTAENRHMVQSFLSGERPAENFSDGVNVTELLMTAYMSAEQEKTIPFPPPDLDFFIPTVAKGEWNPRKA